MESMPQQVVDTWEVNAPAWIDVVRNRLIESRRVGTDAAIISAVLSSKPGTVLDVGCGEGWLCRALAKHKVEAVGVDASGELIQSARQAGSQDYFVFDMCRPGPWERAGRKFDCVVCNFSILDERLDQALIWMRDCLASDGYLLIQTTHPWSELEQGSYTEGWRLERWSAFGPGFRVPMPWFFRTLSGWFELFGRCGFRIEAVEEPLHPVSGRPLSLLLRLRAEG